MAEKPGCAKTGCGCALVLAIGAAAMLLILSQAATMPTVAPIAKGPATQWITYVGEKDYDDQSLVMYALDGVKWDDAEFEKLCKYEGAKNKGTFRVIVVFNKAQNAQFSQYPPSAAYSADPEIDTVARNIVAMYLHNGINGNHEFNGYKPKGIFH
jgi:hypothetical protein